MDERVTVELPPYEHEPPSHAPDEWMHWELRDGLSGLSVEEAQAVFEKMGAFMLEAVGGESDRFNLFLQPHTTGSSETREAA